MDSTKAHYFDSSSSEQGETKLQISVVGHSSRPWNAFIIDVSKQQIVVESIVQRVISYLLA